MTPQELVQMIKKRADDDRFKSATPANKQLMIREMLMSHPGYAGMGAGNQAQLLLHTQQALGLDVKDPGLGEATQQVLDVALPVAGGTAGAALGAGGGPLGIATGGVAGAGAGSLMTEITRPFLTEESETNITEISKRVAANMAGEAVGQGVGYLGVKALKASSNVVKNAIRKSLVGTGSESKMVQGAKRVFESRGVGMAPFQIRGKDPAGLGAVLEEISLNGIASENVVKRMQQKQISAANAYLEEIGGTIAGQADGPSTVLFIEKAMTNRRDLGRAMERSLFAKVDQAVGGSTIDISKVIANTQKHKDVTAIRDVVGPYMPEAFTTPTAASLPGAPGKLAAKTARAEAKRAASEAAKLEAELAQRAATNLPEGTDELVIAAKQARAEAKRLGAIAQSEEANVAETGASEFAQEIELAQGPQTLSIKGAMSRISELRKAARNAKGEAAENIRNVANAAANQLEETVSRQIPPEAQDMWDAARSFTKMKNETLNNRAMLAMLKGVSDEAGSADTFFDVALRKKNSNNMLKLKEALDKPIMGPGGEMIPGANLWSATIKPRIFKAIIDQGKVGAGRDISEFSGKKLINAMQKMSKRQTDALLGNGTFAALKDFGDALKVANAKPTGRFGIFIRSAQIGAAATVAGGGGAIGLATGDTDITLTSVAGGVGIILAPTIAAKMLTSPALMRNLSRAARNPGPKSQALIKVLSRFSAQLKANSVAESQLDETLEELNEVKQSPYGAFVPLDFSQRRQR